MELTGLFPIVKRWLVVILMATGMATVIGAFLGSTADKTYEAKTQLLVGPLSTDTDTMRASGALAQTYAELATSDSVLQPVADALDVPSGELSTGVRATANSTTRFLVVRARAHEPAGAADIANAVSDELIDLSRQGAIRPEGQLRVLDPATAPGSPISPRLDLIVPLAAVAGLLGSLTLVLLFEYVGDTAESADKVSAATGTITIPVHRGRSRAYGSSRRSDPLHVVATQVELAGTEVRSVVLTGVADLDGTGGLVLDLAETWAERHDRVLVVDAGGGEITEVLGWSDLPGLGDHLAGRPAVTSEVAPRVDLLTRGQGRIESVKESEAQASLAQFSTSYDLIVIHAPSAATSAGALVWSSVADVTVLVARRFHARRAAINEVSVNLRAVRTRLAFAILHDAPRQASLHEWSHRLAEVDQAAAVEGATPIPAPVTSNGGGTDDRRRNGNATGNDDKDRNTGNGQRRKQGKSRSTVTGGSS